MKRGILFYMVMCALGSLALATTPSMAASGQAVTVAVFGDWPYSSLLKTNAANLYNSVNNDADVSLVIHVGDIHSGSMPCIGAGLSPLPAGSKPTYNQEIFDIFQKFNDPFVYTPGDNEWTDCHKVKESQSGYPLNELTAVRNLFFPAPGFTIGGVQKAVTSQALAFDKSDPADAQFVENVMWSQSNVQFVTLNIPGSNNDGLPWNGAVANLPSTPFLNEAARLNEVAQRNGANLRWLKHAFTQAKAKKVGAMVIAIQADMWDPAATVTGGDGLNNYDQFVQALADLTVDFGRPVLLLNGDSHLYQEDRPLDPTDRTGCSDTTTLAGCTGGVVSSSIHHTQAVPNLTRITVQGSINVPNEWLKLTIDPSSPTVFTWENVCYSSCN